jgi:lipopolysaccharide transport system ATP-binding protein
MMIDTHLDQACVKVESVSKCYRIFDDPKDRLKQALFRGRRKYYKDFWALQEVSFDVNPGEALGIIGKNGSGKSTLLQIICGTLTPTSGSLQIQGRIAALLELGSGFNPEFTGIENIYLNASLLGLEKAQIEAKLDKILAFADIGEFVKQPVKCYSSGMIVRLAFAIIAHVDADILIVDEALAVGDIFFVQKCMHFINNFKQDNILLLVTHDTQAVLSVCSHGLVLDKGRPITGKVIQKQAIDVYTANLYADHGHQTLPAQTLPSVSAGEDRPTLSVVQGFSPQEGEAYGQTLQAVIDARLDQGKTIHTEIQYVDGEFFGSGECQIKEISLRNSNAEIVTLVGEGEKVILKIVCIADVKIESPIIGFAFRNDKGMPVLADNTFHSRKEIFLTCDPGQHIITTFEFTMPRLAPGRYSVHAAIARGTQSSHIQMHYFHDACCFDVISEVPCLGLMCPSDMFINLSIEDS